MVMVVVVAVVVVVKVVVMVMMVVIIVKVMVVVAVTATAAGGRAGRQGSMMDGRVNGLTDGDIEVCAPARSMFVHVHIPTHVSV